MNSKQFSSMVRSKFPELTDFWASYGGGEIHLRTIVVDKKYRNQGIGTRVMNFIVEYAEKNRLSLYLSPDTSLGGSSRGRLVKFYKRFGFVENKGRNKDYKTMEAMHRKAKSE